MAEQGGSGYGDARGGITASNFEQRVMEIRNFAQQNFTSPHARDIVSSTVGVIQSAWTLERQQVELLGSGQTRSGLRETTRNDR